MGQKRNAHSILVGMPIGKTPFQRLGIRIFQKYDDCPESKDHWPYRKINKIKI
jgi:hypothetical protein